MAEKTKVYSSKLKHGGFFTFKDYYLFCYDWLENEVGLNIAEKGYTEKVKGEAREVEVKWECERKLTDYFKMEMKVKIKADPLKKAVITKDGVKKDTNEGVVEMEVSGTLVRDYDGKFESSAFNKFLRGVYERWVIPSRIDEFEDKVAGDCDTFLGQAKAFLDLEGKK